MSLGPVLLVALAVGALTARAPSIAPDRVRDVVSDRGVSLQACYQEGLDRDAKLKGTVSVEMSVGESGVVMDAKSTGATTLKDAEVVGCVVKVMKSLDFGKQDGPQTVKYALLFEPDPPKKDDSKKDEPKDDPTDEPKKDE